MTPENIKAVEKIRKLLEVVSGKKIKMVDENGKPIKETKVIPLNVKTNDNNRSDVE